MSETVITTTITILFNDTGYLNIVHRAVQFSEYELFEPRREERVWKS